MKYQYLIIVVILFSFILKNKKKKETKVCLCSIGKNENSYLNEFITHYKKLGYNHIFIYDNNDINGERMDSIVNNSDFISIINYRGYRNKKDNSQYEAYYDCYNNNNRKYDWLSFFDFDEFLEILPEGQTIQKFLENERYEKCQDIKINWLLYSSEKEVIYYEKKPLSLRFKKKLLDRGENILIKSTVRGGLVKNYWSRWENSHTSIDTFKSCSSSGRKVSGKTAFINPPDYKFAFIKHYQTKSFEEYCLRLKRGWPDSTNKTMYITNLLNDNKNSKKKLSIIKRILNITFF
jgi:hypothetical protein